MADQLLPVSALSNVNDPTGYTNVPSFSLMFSNPAPDDTYYQSESLGLFSQQHANMSVGMSDMVTASTFVGTSTAWYGFLGSRNDGGTVASVGGYIVGTSEFFSGAGGYGYGIWAPFCFDPDEGLGPYADYSKGPFSTPGWSGILLLGGNRCLAKLIDFDLNDTTGDQSVTGIGFEPMATFFLGCINAPDATTVDGTNFMMGAADDDLNQWTGATRSEFFSANPMLRYSVWYDDACISHIGAPSFSGITTFDQKASYLSSDTDGFTINLSAAGYDSAGTPMKVRALCVRPISGEIMVGTGTQGDTTITTSPIAPRVMMFFSTQRPSGGVTSTADCYAAIGATDYTGLERAYWEGTITDTVPDNWAYTSTVSSIRWADYNQNLLAEANVDLTGLSSTVPLTWTTDGGQGYRFGWVAWNIGDTDHKPVPVTGPALGITPTQATLTGTVTPNSEDGVMVTYYFEWGITSSYGNTTPGGAVGDGFLPIGVAEIVIIPVPIGTHYRIVAVDEFGCLYPGEDMVIEQLAAWRSIRYQ